MANERKRKVELSVDSALEKIELAVRELRQARKQAAKQFNKEMAAIDRRYQTRSRRSKTAGNG